jgi:hypothetical protein
VSAALGNYVSDNPSELGNFMSADTLNGVARELLQLGTPEEQTAGRSVAEIAGRSSGELMAIAGYALRAV